MDDYDFDNWHKDVPVDEEEVKRKLKRKLKAEQKKKKEEAKKKKREEKEKEKEEESDNEDDDKKKEKKSKKDKKDKKDKKEKKEKKKEKKRKRENHEDEEEKDASDGSDSEDSDNEKKKRKKETPAPVKKGEFGIWVGNLAFSTTSEMLRKFFKKCGTITRINLPINKQTKNNKGFAYVDFEDQESVDNAVKLSEQTLENRNLLIKSSKDFRGRPAKQDNTNAAANTTDGKGFGNNNRNGFNNNGYNKEKKVSSTLFIGNLPYAATSEGITKCFKEFGEIANVRMATFEDNPEKCKGFAYVDYGDIESATKAMNSNKKPRLLGRMLRVEYASEEATRRGYNRLHKKLPAKDKPAKPAEPKPIAIAKWDGELVTFKGKKTVFGDDDGEED